MSLPTRPPSAPAEAAATPNATGAPMAPVAFDARATLEALLLLAVQQGASDVHIRAGSPPILRIRGALWPIEHPPLTEGQSEALVLACLQRPRDRQVFGEEQECDFALALAGIGRFRGSAYRARGSASVVLRHVREQIPTIDELGLPPAAAQLAEARTGLVLVSGPTGSGKSTSLAAMVGAINAQRACHILTIEDPIEFLHEDRKASISQREIHTDSASFAKALRSALRQDPDVILVGEIRDLETLRTALQAAETGHLVLASVHAKTTVDTVNRLIDMFPEAEQRQARLTLAETFQGCVCQRLVPGVRSGEVHLVAEVLMGTARVREAIADPEKTMNLPVILAEGEFYRMRSFEQDLVRHVLAGNVSVQEAERIVSSPADLMVALKRAGYAAEGQGA